MGDISREEFVREVGEPPPPEEWGPSPPVVAMCDLVQALIDYRLQVLHGPPPTKVYMSLLARRAFLAEMVRRRIETPTEPERPPDPFELPVLLDESAEGFSVRLA